MKIKITHLESTFINDKSTFLCLFDLKLNTEFDSTRQRDYWVRLSFQR